VQGFVSTLEALEPLLVVFAKFRIPGGKKPKSPCDMYEGFVFFLKKDGHIVATL
jgi:hypothetical protein